MPQLPFVLGALPETLQRSLYDAFQLQLRYHRPRHEVSIRVTIRADALPSLTQLVKEAAGQPGVPTGNGEPNGHVPMFWAPPAGFEPAHPPPEGGALSPELRGLQDGKRVSVPRRHHRPPWAQLGDALGMLSREPVGTR